MFGTDPKKYTEKISNITVEVKLAVGSVYKKDKYRQNILDITWNLE